MIGTIFSFSLLLLSATQHEDDLKKRADYLFEILRCPTCQNIPIKDSHTQMAETMKKIIIEKLKEGWSDDQIIQYFTKRYGDEILLYPKNKFLGYLPFMFFVIGFGTLILFFVIRKGVGKNKGDH